MRSLCHKASAEYNFFFLLFGLLEQESSYYHRLRYNFATQVEEALSKNNLGELTVHDYDRVFYDNRNGQNLEWKIVGLYNSDYYGVYLNGVGQMIEKITENPSKIRNSELNRLRIFAQDVINYRLSIKSHNDQELHIDLWENIERNLALKCSSYQESIQTFSGSPRIIIFDSFRQRGNSKLFLMQ